MAHNHQQLSLEPATTADMAHTAPSLDATPKDLGAVFPQQVSLCVHGQKAMEMENTSRKQMVPPQQTGITQLRKQAPVSYDPIVCPKQINCGENHEKMSSSLLS